MLALGSGPETVWRRRFQVPSWPIEAGGKREEKEVKVAAMMMFALRLSSPKYDIIIYCIKCGACVCVC